jgi:hypothetical protein
MREITRSIDQGGPLSKLEVRKRTGQHREIWARIICEGYNFAIIFKFLDLSSKFLHSTRKLVHNPNALGEGMRGIVTVPVLAWSSAAAAAMPGPTSVPSSSIERLISAVGACAIPVETPPPHTTLAAIASAWKAPGKLAGPRPLLIPLRCDSRSRSASRNISR